MWTNYEIATGLDKKEGKTRTATYLTCIGADALEIFDGFVFAFICILVFSFARQMFTQLFKVSFASCSNFFLVALYERYCFNKRDQEQGENIDTYVAALRTLVKTCNYGTLEEILIRDRIIIGIRENACILVFSFARQMSTQLFKVSFASCSNFFLVAFSRIPMTILSRIKLSSNVP
jgi:hypothetical protein